MTRSGEGVAPPVTYPQGPKCKRCGSTEKFPTGRCRPCGIARGRAWYATPEYKLYSQARDATPERQAQRKEHAASPEHKEAYSLYYRHYKYGLTSEQQWELLTSQDGKCASCGEPLKPGKDTHLDHDHVTNRARGFLCCQCNVAIGMMRDSPLLLRKAASYLERFMGEPLPADTEPSVRLRLSASQIQTFSNCQRAWAWKYVAGVEEPPSPAAEKGRAVHAELEKYLKGGAIDFTTEIGYIAAAGLEHLPKPGTPGLLIEQEFHFEGPSGHSYLGYKDLEEPGTVTDHKTTSDLRWQKSQEELRADIQATLYATDYFRQHPEEPQVGLRWVYYQTKNTRKSAVTYIRVSQPETWQRFLEIEKIAELMAEASTKQPLDLPANVNHCSAYGGCPHQGRCNLSPFDKMRSYVEQNKLTMLLKNKNGAAAGGAPPDVAAAVAGRQPALAFAPGGVHAGTSAAAPPPASPAVASAPPVNKLLMRVQAAGAPAAAAVGVAAPAGLTTVLPVSGIKTTTGPAPAAAAPAVNPPEYQPPPASPAPLTAEAAGQELAASLAQGDAAEGKVRGRRAVKANLPATGLPVKIKILYIDCGPVGVEVTDAAQLIALAKKEVATQNGLADYRFAEYGQGPGLLATYAAAHLDALPGVLSGVRLDTTTPEGAVILAELMSRAELVVR